MTPTARFVLTCTPVWCAAILFGWRGALWAGISMVCAEALRRG